MFIMDPDFCPSRIQKKQPSFFCSHKCHKKIVNYIIFELVKKLVWAKNLLRIIEFFT